MFNLSTNITSVIVVISMGFYLAAVSYLCVVPIMEALMERRWPTIPNIPAVSENIGIAIAIAGFTYQDTKVTALGVALMLVGGVLGIGKSPSLHPALNGPLAASGVLCVGVLGEYFYLAT
jgi:hypothetical protein